MCTAATAAPNDQASTCAETYSSDRAALTQLFSVTVLPQRLTAILIPSPDPQETLLHASTSHACSSYLVLCDAMARVLVNLRAHSSWITPPYVPLRHI